MKPSAHALFLLAAFTLVGSAHAAPGDVDLSFDAGSSLNNSPYAIAIQPDGKLLIGGDFTTVAGLMRNRIARLNSDGIGDPTFAPGAGANGHVRVVALQPDGKVLMGGWFTAVEGQPRGGVARLNPDGSLDESFAPGPGADDSVFALVLQPDGKVVIGGYFTNVNGVARHRIARLNADGTLDPSFNPGSGFNSYGVYAVVLQPDGRLLAGGSFTTYDGVVRNGITRLNPDGSLDTTFNVGSGVNGFRVKAAALQPDGRVVIGGSFSQVNGVARNSIARLYSDGGLDLSFNPGTGLNGTVQVIELQADGKILVGGQFSYVNGTDHNSVVRLNSDGSVDPTFHPSRGVGGPGIAWVRAQADGMILLSGYPFGQHNMRDFLGRVYPDGRLDLTFNPASGISGYGAFSAATLSGGRILVWGNFTEVAGHPRPGITRLEPSGQLDTTFQPPAMTGDSYDYYTNRPVIYSAAVLPDGKLLVGGTLTVVDGQRRGQIARLHADGSFDPTYAQGPGADGAVYRVLLAPDGTVLISGNFARFDGISRNYFARLNPDGSLDHAFNPTVEGFVELALQPDGRILLGGHFTSVNGIARKNVARLDSDGSLDLTFDPGSGPDHYVTSLALLADGKVLIGGFFTNVAGVHRPRLARLNSNGTLDASFTPNFQPENFPPGGSLAGSYFGQPDGKVLVWGGFTSVGGVPRPGFARLNSDGTLDTAFDPATDPNLAGYPPIASAVLQPDSKVLIAGPFSSVNGVPRGRIARLLGDEAPVIITQPASRTNVVGTAASFTVVAAGTAPLRYQWYKDGAPLSDSGRISGSTTASLTIPHVQFQDDASYSVTLTNLAGMARSTPAVLRVVVPPVARISVRPLARFPGVTDLLVIAPDGRAASLTLDGSQSAGAGAPPPIPVVRRKHPHRYDRYHHPIVPCRPSPVCLARHRRHARG